MHNKILYIGEFPPPYGGVTIKNKLIYTNIFDSKCEIIDLYSCKRNMFNLFPIGIKLILTIILKYPIFIGVGKNQRIFYLLNVVKFFGGLKGLNKVSIFMMGGKLQCYISDKPYSRKLLQNVYAIYSESQKIKEIFESLDIMNVHYLPNCRVIDESITPKANFENDELRLIFFSKICKEKGVPFIFNMMEILNTTDVHYRVDFYGHIDSKYLEEFNNAIQHEKNAFYKGIFDAINDNVYEKLREYDVLLLPTVWEGEGVPGVLIEAKMAGIPSIVTNHNYNTEIVLDGQEGIVLGDDIVHGLVENVHKLYNDRILLKKISEGSFDSRYRYDINTYRMNILDTLTQ